MMSEAVSNWSRRLGILLVVVFCFELGVFLLVFPWMDPWTNNWMPDLVPAVGKVWRSPFFRGAISGLGAVNLYISLLEVLRLWRPKP